jgi:hypothetical protein
MESPLIFTCRASASHRFVAKWQPLVRRRVLSCDGIFSFSGHTVSATIALAPILPTLQFPTLTTIFDAFITAISVQCGHLQAKLYTFNQHGVGSKTRVQPVLLPPPAIRRRVSTSKIQPCRGRVSHGRATA